MRILFSLLYLPIGLVLRFISAILRVPRLTFPFNFSTHYRIPRQIYPDSRSATRRWITSLEEETGAVNFKILPDFFDGTYEEVLDVCQKEGRIACVILVSAEHDDVAEFKRLGISPLDETCTLPAVSSTLTHPDFVRMLSENNFVVWGGDIRDKDTWDG